MLLKFKNTIRPVTAATFLPVIMPDEARLKIGSGINDELIQRHSGYMRYIES